MARPIQFYNAGHRQRLKILKMLAIYIQLRCFAARYVRWPFICFGETEGLEMVKIHQWGPKEQTFFFVFSVFSGCRVTLLNMFNTNNMKQPCVCVFFVFLNKHVSILGDFLFPTSRGFSLPPMTLIVDADVRRALASIAARHLRHLNAHQKAFKLMQPTNLQHKKWISFPTVAISKPQKLKYIIWDQPVGLMRKFEEIIWPIRIGHVNRFIDCCIRICCWQNLEFSKQDCRIRYRLLFNWEWPFW